MACTATHMPRLLHVDCTYRYYTSTAQTGLLIGLKCLERHSFSSKFALLMPHARSPVSAREGGDRPRA